VLFYLVAYALMNMGAFAVLVHLENARDDENAVRDSEDANVRISELNGLAWRQPLVAGAMTVFLLSLAGIPPTAGFFGKFIIFREAVQQGLIGLVLVGVLNTVISVYYYLRPIISMYTPDAAAQDGVGGGDIVVESGGVATLRTVARPLSLGVGLAVVLCAAAVIGMVALQSAVFPLAQQASGLSAPVSQTVPLR
jgi:NADH:ubiquinone oxidoreductase subunit 2 (subunit N)